MKSYIIAVDFDRTLTKKSKNDNIVPDYLKMMVMREAIKNGHRLILWTCRAGEGLKLAKEVCLNFEVDFVSVNQNDPEHTRKKMEEGVAGEGYFDSPKIYADFYLDDKSVPYGEKLDWAMIDGHLNGHMNWLQIERDVRRLYREFDRKLVNNTVKLATRKKYKTIYAFLEKRKTEAWEIRALYNLVQWYYKQMTGEELIKRAVEDNEASGISDKENEERISA